jgi:amino acid transporter
VLLTLSSITPAASVFTIVPGAIAQAGTGALLSMIIGALLSVPIAYIYAELSSAFPIAGGEYCMVSRLAGKGAGFATLGMTVVGSILSPAVLALGAGEYLGAVIPEIDPVDSALVIIAGATLLAVLHVRTNAWITGGFLILELMALATLVVLGISHLHRSPLEIALHPVWLQGDLIRPTPLSMIGLATTICLFAYDGAGSAIYFSEEIRKAPKIIASVILWSLAVTIIAEFLPVASVLLGTPSIGNLLRSEAPFVEFVSSFGGHFLASAISISVAIAIFNSVLATILQNARFLYCTGRDGLWGPIANTAITAIHPQYGSPWLATLLCGAASMLACYLGLDLILLLTGTSIAIVYLAMSIASIAGRQFGTSSHAQYRMPFYPIPPIVALLTLGYIIYTSFSDPAVGRPSLIINGMIIAILLCYYYLYLRKAATWVLRTSSETER